MRAPSLLAAAALQHCVFDARVTFVGAQGVLYANEARNAAEREIDCSDISAVLADVNEKCCNGGRGSSSQTGHRRAQGSSETCVLDTCTPACAVVYMAWWQRCSPAQELQAADQQMNGGLSKFYSKCVSARGGGH